MSDEKPLCLKCGGTGKIQVDDLTVTQCICAFARAMKEHLGSEIALAPNIRDSLLFIAARPEPKVDRTKDNLFLKGYWVDLLPHIKAALVGRGLFFRFKVVTDEKLKTVWLGNESYTSRAKGKRDEIETNNSLTDLVGPDIDLVIVRLCTLGHPNRAMPGIIKETIMLRDTSTKATWLVEDPDKGYFGPGSFSYSEELAEYVDRHFEVVDITDKKRTPIREPVETVIEDVSVDAPMPVRKSYAEKSRFETKIEDGFGALGGGGGYKKAPWKSKKGSGGGPLG